MTSDEDKLDKILVTVTEIKTNCPHCVRRTEALETEVYGKENYKGLKPRVAKLEWRWGSIATAAGAIGALAVTVVTTIVNWFRG